MAHMMTRSEIARTALSAHAAPAARSVPVRLIRRVVDVFQGRHSPNGRRAVPARVVMVRAQAVADPAAVAAVARPRVPVRLIPRHHQGPDVQAAMAASLPAGRAIPLRVPLRVAWPAAPGRTRKRSTAFYYQLAISALLVGAVITVLGPATFATFSSAVTNSAVFSTGTLVLGDTVNSGTECLSFTGGANTIDSQNSNAACDTTWAVAGTSAEPGQPITAPQITVVLHGSLTTSTFSLYARPLAVAANPACNSTTTAGETYSGGSNICNVLQIYIQQYTSNTFSTPLACLYGAGIGGATCTGFDATHTLTDFGSCHKPASNIACAGGEASGPLTIAVPAGSPPTSYFKVFANLPLNVGNGYQGQSAGLGFTWNIAQ